MLVNVSAEASVIALYGVDFLPGRTMAYYRSLVDWFDLLNSHPDRIGVSGGGFNDTVSEFDVIDRQLMLRGFDGVRGFSLYKLTPGATIPGYHWCVTADVSADDCYCIIGTHSSIARIPSESMLGIARALIRDFTPAYGIGYRREMRLGPSLYAIGGCMGLQPWGADKPEGDRIERWREQGIKQRCYANGYLRGVFPWNFLTKSQLNQFVGEETFGDWILRNPVNGRLSAIDSRMWLWEVEESQIPHVESGLSRLNFDRLL